MALSTGCEQRKKMLEKGKELSSVWVSRNFLSIKQGAWGQFWQKGNQKEGED